MVEHRTRQIHQVPPDQPSSLRPHHQLTQIFENQSKDESSCQGEGLPPMQIPPPENDAEVWLRQGHPPGLRQGENIPRIQVEDSPKRHPFPLRTK